MPCGAELATRNLDARCEAHAKQLVAPAPDSLVANNHAPLEQQLFNVALAQLKPEYQRTVQLMTDAVKRRP